MAMLTLPAAVVQATVPWMFWSLPSIVTFAVEDPLEAVAPLLPDDALELPDDDLLLEQPDRPTTTIAVAAAATVTERFTRFSFVLWRPVDNDGPFRQYAALLEGGPVVSANTAGRTPDVC